ncbi:hypothetical protein GGR98_000895 [Parageobacillus caldoxylosilyticus]|jgi:hypothetical protein|nr:hypothetical protein [Parageobacillus caldoxylosilyticus]
MIQSRFYDGSVLLMNELGAIRYNQQYISSLEEGEGNIDGKRYGKFY